MEKHIKIGVILIAAGIVSLLTSIRASGVDYMIWESRMEKGGPDVASTPTWILAWHNISFAIGTLGVIWLIVTLVRHRKSATKYGDYLNMPRRKYWIGIALIVIACIAGLTRAFIPFMQWYKETENASFLYIDLAWSTVILICLFAGTIRLIDDVATNSRIHNAQRQSINALNEFPVARV